MAVPENLIQMTEALKYHLFTKVFAGCFFLDGVIGLFVYSLTEYPLAASHLKTLPGIPSNTG